MTDPPHSSKIEIQNESVLKDGFDPESMVLEHLVTWLLHWQWLEPTSVLYHKLDFVGGEQVTDCCV